jgi:hypothetical protein
MKRLRTVEKEKVLENREIFTQFWEKKREELLVLVVENHKL